ncbi:hypothetical protein BJ138DRAFT_1161477 [Hygrophoropsis aurantiaca]|uniref:Uncharacterized protein n=1 Tax=Hygrophoropsis aurantiaca TaxID=72124 RepID=A0ACB8A169_9AGAM|nr:hypothetical protein BJ138DRAFT_1161477 [Hygrophoropsis aurantiaca]
MGTWGKRVYRYKGVYFEYLHRWASPRDLGVELLQFGRRGDFVALHAELGQMLAAGQDEKDECNVTRVKPLMDLGYREEYMYELDFDRNVFLFQGQPFYRLDNVPSDEEFLQNVGRNKRGDLEPCDIFGNAVPRQECPMEHIYQWKAAPPTVDLDALRARIPNFDSESGTEVPLHDVLKVPVHLLDGEATRKRLYEIEVVSQMSIQKNSALAREFETFVGYEKIPLDSWKMAFEMLNSPFTLQITPPQEEYFIVKPKRAEFTWVRRDVVAHITTHLDDSHALQAAVLRIVGVCVKAEKDEEYRPDILFGVAFSVNHCVIVRVSKTNDSVFYQHTPPLQFLPSLYADSPSTPGIVAVARLAFKPDVDIIQRALRYIQQDRHSYIFLAPTSNCPEGSSYSLYERLILENRRSKRFANGVQNLCSKVAPARTNTTVTFLKKSVAERLPPEIWTLIASFVGDLISLTFLGCVSRTCEQAVCSILRHPHNLGERADRVRSVYRLVKPVPTEHSESDDPAKRWNKLRSATFDAVSEGRPICLWLHAGPMRPIE